MIIKMKLKDFLFFFLIFIVVLVFINSFVVFKIFQNDSKFTGHASGYVNLTINSAVVLNLSIDSIDWGAGVINGSFSNATLYTRGSDSGVVQRGNWTGENAKAIVIQNIGSINCSLYIQTGKNAHDFFESASSTNEEYRINVSNKEAGSCAGGASLGQWMDVNKTSGGTKYCSQFSNSDNNEVYLDMLLTVPLDSNKVGEQTDTITVVGNVPG